MNGQHLSKMQKEVKNKRNGYLKVEFIFIAKMLIYNDN